MPEMCKEFSSILDEGQKLTICSTLMILFIKRIYIYLQKGRKGKHYSIARTIQCTLPTK